MNSARKTPLYTISKNEIYGRFMVADRDIKEGELILKEQPLVLGSSLQAVPICLKCCKRLRTNVQVCGDCNIAPICSKTCKGALHSPEECSAFKATQLKSRDLVVNSQVILPLRCLLLKSYDPEKWRKLLLLEPHLEERKNSWIWRSHEINVVRVLKELGVKEAHEKDLVQKICGILDVNSFEVRPPEFTEVSVNTDEFLRGVYLETALMAHDCVGNTHLAVDDAFKLSVHASRNIKKGDTIFFNYSNVLMGTSERKQHLKAGKYFECCCQRCKDPSEFGTDISSLICPRCYQGIVRPAFGDNKHWKCTKCSHRFNANLIRTTTMVARNCLGDLEPLDIPAAEKLLKKLLRTFTKNHYLILELEQNMIALYTQTLPNTQNLTRKIELCKHLLEVFKIVEPGISRLQAVAMHQQQSTEVFLAQKRYKLKETTKEEYLTSLLEAEIVLKQAVKWLLYEPVSSPEGRLGQRALQELRDLRKLVVQVQSSDGDKNGKNKKRNRK